MATPPGPLIVNCPKCYRALTAVNGEKPELIATPCGHLFHRRCLHKSYHKSQRCVLCMKRFVYGSCITYYPELADPEEVRAPAFTTAPTPQPATAPQPQPFQYGVSTVPRETPSPFHFSPLAPLPPGYQFGSSPTPSTSGTAPLPRPTTAQPFRFSATIPRPATRPTPITRQGASCGPASVPDCALRKNFATLARKSEELDKQLMTAKVEVIRLKERVQNPNKPSPVAAAAAVPSTSRITPRQDLRQLPSPRYPQPKPEPESNCVIC